MPLYPSLCLFNKIYRVHVEEFSAPEWEWDDRLFFFTDQTGKGCDADGVKMRFQLIASVLRV